MADEASDTPPVKIGRREFMRRGVGALVAAGVSGCAQQLPVTQQALAGKTADFETRFRKAEKKVDQAIARAVDEAVELQNQLGLLQSVPVFFGGSDVSIIPPYGNKPAKLEVHFRFNNKTHTLPAAANLLKSLVELGQIDREVNPSSPLSYSYRGDIAAKIVNAYLKRQPATLMKPDTAKKDLLEILDATLDKAFAYQDAVRSPSGYIPAVLNDDKPLDYNLGPAQSAPLHVTIHKPGEIKRAATQATTQIAKR